MINNDLAETPLRVAILSDSAIQRAALKQVLKNQGTQIVHEDSLGAYHPNDLAGPTDVLLVDLKNAGDLSLQKLDDLLEDNRLPILFNDGETIPTDEGPVRDDWVNNLTTKLFILANKPIYKISKKNKVTKLKPSDSTNTLLKKDFPRITIVSKSKTRRNVLQNILHYQGLTTVHIKSFDDVDIEKTRKTTDILLLDQHNIGEGDIKFFETLKKQKIMGYIICDSSKLPLRSKDRQALGAKLTQKLTSKASRLYLNKPDATPNALYEGGHSTQNKPKNVPTIGEKTKLIEDTGRQIDLKVDMETIEIAKAPLFKQDPAHWADRLSDALAGVRRNLRAIERNKISSKENTRSNNTALKTANDTIPAETNNNDAKNRVGPLSLTPNGTNSTAILLKQKQTQFVIEPIIKKTARPTPLNNSASQNTLQNAEHNTKATSDTIENDADSAILDIDGDMAATVKHVPTESDSNATLLLDSSDHDTSIEKPVENNTLELTENLSLQKPPQKSLDKKSKPTKKKVELIELPDSPPSNFEFSNELIENNMLSGEKELEFNLELSTLNLLDTYENDGNDLSMLGGSSKKEKGKKIFGIDWSNPFK